MKLAVSNIAWAADEAEAAYRILADQGVHGIEVAPGILFPDCPTPLAPPAASVREAVRQAQAYGHRFVSLQAVHFGLADASLFGPPEQRSRFVGALRQAVDLAAALSIPNIVLGSPRNRVRPPELEPEAAFAVAAEALSPLADHARASGVAIALEANPARYGTNFMTHFDEALKLCGLIGDAAFGVNYDLGERLINGQAEDIAGDIKRPQAMLRHVQISAPDLLPPLDFAALLPALFDALEEIGYPYWTSIEMRRSPDEPLQAIEAVTREVARIAGTSTARGGSIPPNSGR